MRARNIKPGFFENEDLAELSPEARLLFIGLWCMADKRGRLDDIPKKIKRTLLPYDEVDVDNLLTSLHEKGFIVRYEVMENKYIEIVNFGKHQRPHPKEKESQIPSSREAVERCDPGVTQEEPRQDQGATKVSPFPSDIRNVDIMNPDVMNEDVTTHSSLSEESLDAVLNSDTDKSSILSTPKLPKEPKKQYADYVSMTTNQYNKLLQELGEDRANWCISKLDTWKGSNPTKAKKRKDDYLAIRNWVIDALKEHEAKIGKTMNSTQTIIPLSRNSKQAIDVMRIAQQLDAEVKSHELFSDG